MDAGLSLPIPHDVGAAFRAAPVAIVHLAVLAPLVGRIFLAWMPAGRAGGHSPRELPATWAVSLLVGLTWFLALRPLAESGAFAYVAFGVPALALVILLLTSPQGLVPRHEPAPLAMSTAIRVAIAAAVCATPACIVLALQQRANAGDVLIGFAAAILAHEALSIARVQPWLRVAALLAIAATIAWLPAYPTTLASSSEPEGVLERHATLGACAAAAGMVAWLRRGDRRGLAIASLGIAFLRFAAPGAPGVGLALAIALIVASARPSRRRAGAWAAGGVALGILLAHSAERGPSLPYCLRAPFQTNVEFALGAVILLAFAVDALMRSRLAPATWNPSGAPESREARTLVIAALLTFVLGSFFAYRPSAGAEESHYPHISLLSASFFILLIAAVAIRCARTLDRPPAARPQSA